MIVYLETKTKKGRSMIKRTIAEWKEMIANARSGFRTTWWRGRYVGFYFTYQERSVVDKPPVLCGFMLNLAFFTIYYGI